MKDNIQIVKILIDNGADINMSGPYKFFYSV